MTLDDESLKTGDEIFISAKVVNMDANPHHGAAVQIQVVGFAPQLLKHGLRDGRPATSVTFWVHALDQDGILIERRK